MNTQITQATAAVRRFNRFYTRKIGALGDQHLDSPFSLTEVRALYELQRTEGLTATELAKLLNVDLGYLSRILKGFEMKKLVAKRPSPKDGRQQMLSLTDKGEQAFAPLNNRATEAIDAMLQELTANEQKELINAMEKIESLLSEMKLAPAPFVLRTHQPGDMGWIVHRHAVLYSKEYGYNEQFESLVAEVVATFIKNFDPKRERCWIAERNGQILGSIFLVSQSQTIAQLRLFLVEPSARGQGVGARLLRECIRFANDVGYSQVTLWTNDVQTKARRLYEHVGFTLTKEEPHSLFGPQLVGQTFDLKLVNEFAGEAGKTN